MFLSENLQQKWQAILEHPDLPAIKDSYKRAVTSVLLENQERSLREERSAMFEAAPTNNIAATSGIDKYDPIMIGLVRRAMPNLMAYDICGVQPMTGPTGLIFAMRSIYANATSTKFATATPEALYNEANTAFSSVNGTNAVTQTGASPADLSAGTEYTRGTGMTTAQAEALGDGAGNQFQEMAFSIEKIAVTAKSRALKAEYTMELAQDLKAVHGLDAEQELANILSTEILAEINREVVRTINITATVGAQENVTTAGTFNLDVDANGRWSVEKFKGLMFQLERESNAIAKATRRGKGNVLICSSDVASALQMAGVLDYTPALASNNLQVDDTGNTFAGVLNGRIKVYIDPYFAATSGTHYATIGYKGTSAFDAGLFYCPYVPLQMVRAVGQDTFQPKIGFKTRYGMVANPFATSAGDGALAFANKNIYYRRIAITNLM